MSTTGSGFALIGIDTPAGALPCVVRGPTQARKVIILPPLFEEMNRTRSLLAGIGRHLAAAGVASWLPDLPGTGDSELPTSAMNWRLWREAVGFLHDVVAADSSDGVHCFAVRGGALLADAAPFRSNYFLVPAASGERLLRELLRARLAADQERGEATTVTALEARLAIEPLEVAGYAITPALASDLRNAKLATAPTPARTVGLTDGGDRSFDGPPVWRQAEPAAADVLAQAVAADVAHWLAACDAR